MKHAVTSHGMSERHACRLTGQYRSTQRRAPRAPREEARLLADMRRLATKHPRYGYRRIHRMLLREGWRVNHKRVQRLWRREGMRVPRKRRIRRALGHSANSCTLRSAERPNHVGSYDFVMSRTEDGRRLKFLVLLDEYTRECLTLHVARSITAVDVVDLLAEVAAERGLPEHIRSDNGPEFIAEEVRRWLDSVGSNTLFIAPGSPWENAYVESFNGRLADELLDREIFVGLAEAEYMAAKHREEYNTERIHSSLGYLTPREFAASCAPSGSASLRLRERSSDAEIASTPDPASD